LAKKSETCRQDRRLGVDGFRQRFLRPCKDQIGQGKTQHLIGGAEDVRDVPVLFRKSFAHSYRLRALTRK